MKYIYLHITEQKINNVSCNSGSNSRRGISQDEEGIRMSGANFVILLLSNWSEIHLLINWRVALACVTFLNLTQGNIIAIVNPNCRLILEYLCYLHQAIPSDIVLPSLWVFVGWQSKNILLSWQRKYLQDKVSRRDHLESNEPHLLSDLSPVIYCHFWPNPTLGQHSNHCQGERFLDGRIVVMFVEVKLSGFKTQDKD